MSEMKFVEISDEIDLSSWGLFDAMGDLAEEINDVIGKRVTKTLRETFKEDPPKLSLPFPWSPDDPDLQPDPLTLYVELPLGKDDSSDVIYSCALEVVIDDMIEEIEDLEEEVGREKWDCCAKIAARLRELADKLDKVP